MKTFKRLVNLLVSTWFIMPISILLYQFDGIVKSIGLFGSIYALTACVLSFVFMIIIEKLCSKEES